MESLGFHPLCTDSQKALAMKELTHNLITQAYLRGIGEIYFFGSDHTTNDFAERQGFRQVQYPVYLVRVQELETSGQP
jgi:Tat protein secretion system quality control protein TatD with DNase activity